MIYPFIETHECWGRTVKLLVTQLRDWNWCSYGAIVQAHGELSAREAKRRFIEGFRDRIHAGGLVFDLGANIGYLSTIFAQQVGPTGRVIAVEPHPGNCVQIDLQALLNDLKNITIVHRAVTDRAGKTIHFRGEVVSPLLDTDSHECQTTTIDELAEMYGMPDAIKMDVEGCELFALRGAAKVLAARHAAWEIEIHDFVADNPASLARFGHTAQEVFATMIDAGYSAWLDGSQITAPSAASILFVCKEQ